MYDTCCSPGSWRERTYSVHNEVENNNLRGRYTIHARTHTHVVAQEIRDTPCIPDIYIYVIIITPVFSIP